MGIRKAFTPQLFYDDTHVRIHNGSLVALLFSASSAAICSGVHMSSSARVLTPFSLHFL